MLSAQSPSGEQVCGPKVGFILRASGVRGGVCLSWLSSAYWWRSCSAARLSSNGSVIGSPGW